MHGTRFDGDGDLFQTSSFIEQQILTRFRVKEALYSTALKKFIHGRLSPYETEEYLLQRWREQHFRRLWGACICVFWSAGPSRWERRNERGLIGLRLLSYAVMLYCKRARTMWLAMVFSDASTTSCLALSRLRFREILLYSQPGV